MITKNPTPYTTQELSVLVEEYITQQRTEFTLKGLCSYIVYWGMEDGRIEGNKLAAADIEKINGILNRIERDGRISVSPGNTENYIKRN